MATEIKAEPKWTSQRPFTVTESHVNAKWGLSHEKMKCGICRKPFQVGDTARWVCATGHRCLNFFVCEHDDTSDVIEVWQRITKLAQQDEYDLAAKIVELELNLGRCAAAERDGQWQPISTAPKDATWIRLLLKSGEEVKGHWAQDYSGENQAPFDGWFTEGKARQKGDPKYAGGFVEVASPPTHWMPFTRST